MLSTYPFDGDEAAKSAWCIELAERIEWWQRKLPLLGLRQFRIDRVSLVDAPLGRSTSTAAVWTSPTYDSCRFEFHNEEFTELSGREQDEVIVHEWLHVAFRDLTHAIAMADDHLSNSVQDMWDDAVDHAEETLIDRLARQLVALKA